MLCGDKGGAMRKYKGFVIEGSHKYGYKAENTDAVLYGDTLGIIKYKINQFLEHGEVFNGRRKEK